MTNDGGIQQYAPLRIKLRKSQQGKSYKEKAPLKVWKSEFLMDASRSQNPWRTVRQTLGLVNPDSPTKTRHIGRYFANTYARINKRRKVPHTFQKLLQSSPRSLT